MDIWSHIHIHIMRFMALKWKVPNVSRKHKPEFSVFMSELIVRPRNAVYFTVFVCFRVTLSFSVSVPLFQKCFKILRGLLTLGCTTLATFVGGATQWAQVAVLQCTVSIITACATGGNQLKQVLLRHEAPGKCPATWKHIHKKKLDILMT